MRFGRFIRAQKDAEEKPEPDGIMAARFFFVVICAALLSSCAAGNLVRHVQVERWRDARMQQNEIADIRQVKLKSNGDIDICFVGNQISPNSNHTIHLSYVAYKSCGFGIPVSERKTFNNKSCNRNLDRSVLSLGCDLTIMEGDSELVRNSKYSQPYEIRGQRIRGTNPRGYNYQNPKRLPVDVIDIEFGTWTHVGLSMRYPEPEVDPDACNPYKGKVQGDQIQVWIPLCDAMYPRKMVIEDSVYFSIDPAPSNMPPRGFSNKIAAFVDIITSPVQWTLCLLTWGYVCSEPYIGPIVPG